MIKLSLITFLCLTVLCGTPSWACTDFQITTTDGVFIAGRSMEWGQPLHSKLRFHQRGETIQSRAPKGKLGQKWISKFGFVGADGYDIDTVLDGMNEQGLVFSALWFPGTEYQEVPAGAETSAIHALHLGAWILGNFSTVTEATAQIERQYVWCDSVKEIGTIPTLHVALHDATGKNSVIEFVGGQRKTYDNPNSVLTNAPSFDWHRTNLRNYIHIDAANPKPIMAAGTVLAPPGQGSGFLGIPGDWTPPSRFVRATAMREFAKQPANAPEGITLAAHILNAVDIPIGAVRPQQGDLVHSDYTQWALIKDLTNKKLYYRGYFDLSLKSIDLSQVDWTKASSREHVIIDGEK